MELLSLIIFALVLNMDAFATGVSYGMRRIKLPLSSLLIISLLSVFAITLSMLAGSLLAAFVSETFARRLGGLLLLFIGGWFFLQGLHKNNGYKNNGQGANNLQEPEPLFQVRISSLGLVIHVLREPYRADLDRSGEISLREALLLGIALAMDSLGAGFAASMVGFNLVLTAALVGVGHIALTYLGLLAGQSFSTTWFGKQFSILPGCILILLGLSKLW